MKELYTSPEVELTSFVAEEEITAKDTINAGALMGSIVNVLGGDIELDFD